MTVVKENPVYDPKKVEQGALVRGVLIGILLGAILGWLLSRPSEDPETFKQQAAKAEAQVKALTQERDQLTYKVTNLEATRQQLETELSGLRSQLNELKEKALNPAKPKR